MRFPQTQSMSVELCALLTWRPENTVNIWNLYFRYLGHWLSKLNQQTFTLVYESAPDEPERSEGGSLAHPDRFTHSFVSLSPNVKLP